MEKDTLSGFCQALINQSLLYIIFKVQTKLDRLVIGVGFIEVININF